jgi:hypothetical protein
MAQPTEVVSNESRILRHLANFTGSLDNLRTAFGPVREGEQGSGRGEANAVPWISHEEISAAVTRYKSEGLIERLEGAAGKPALYAATDAGMVSAGLEGWQRQLGRGRAWIMSRYRSESSRGLASLAAIVTRAPRQGFTYLGGEGSQNGALKDIARFGLWSYWMMRCGGRRSGTQYLFDMKLSDGRRHFPAMFLYPPEQAQGPGIVFEVFDGSIEKSVMEQIVRIWRSRDSVSHICCYVAEEVGGAAELISGDLEGPKTIWLFEGYGRKGITPPAGYAVWPVLGRLQALSEVPEICDADEGRASDSEIQQRIVDCIRRAGSASILGVAEYLGVDRSRVLALVKDGVSRGWLIRAKTTCNGVSLYWAAAEAGKSLGRLDGRTVRRTQYERERLRVAASLRRAGGGRDGVIFTPGSQSGIWSSDTECEPALIVSGGDGGGNPIGVVLLIGIRSRAALHEVITRYEADRQFSRVLVYSHPAIAAVLEEFVGKDGRIEVVALADSEPVTSYERWSEVKKRKDATGPSARRARRLRIESRSDIHEPVVADLHPIADATWSEIAGAVFQRQPRIRRQGVSRRLIVNLAIWFAENDIPIIEYIERHGCGVSYVTFSVTLRAVYRDGQWETLQEIVRRREPGRRVLNWERIDVRRGSIRLQAKE